MRRGSDNERDVEDENSSQSKNSMGLLRNKEISVEINLENKKKRKGAC